MIAHFCVLAAVLVASLVSAANTTPANGCPAQSGTTTLYTNITSGCTAVATCASQYATCLGSTTNCTKAGECITGYLTCINDAVDSTGCSPLLVDLKLSLMSVNSGQLFNASNAYHSCQARGCALLNATYSGQGGNCSVDLTMLCVSPVNFVASLLLQGQFNAILNDSVKRAKFFNALLADLFRILQIIGITIRRAYIAGSKRQALQTLVVEFQAPGVTRSNIAFDAAFSKLRSVSWLSSSSANAVYQAETGSALILFIMGGSGSPAPGPIPTPPPNSAPTPKPTPKPTATTTSPSNGTSSPGTVNGTAEPSVNTAAPPSPSTKSPSTKSPTTKSPTTSSPKRGSSSSEAGARSLLAAAAIAVMSTAFLF